jgi:hypothetical protein
MKYSQAKDFKSFEKLIENGTINQRRKRHPCEAKIPVNRNIILVVTARTGYVKRRPSEG